MGAVNYGSIELSFQAISARITDVRFRPATISQFGVMLLGKVIVSIAAERADSCAAGTGDRDL